MGFKEATAIEPVGEGRYQMEVPDGWQQGRGAFGGLVLGALLRAMQAEEPDGARLPRSLSGEVVGPVVVGAAKIEVRALRRGHRLTALDARLRQGEEILARASAILAADRSGEPVGMAAVSAAGADQQAPPWESLPVAPVRAPIAPIFTQHYEFRPFAGIPFSGDEAFAVGGWVREAVPPPTYDAPALVALLDSYWPVYFGALTEPRPGATISFMAEFFVDPATLDPTLPLLFRSRGLAERGGYFLEVRELWQDSRPIAFNQQLFAILK